MLVFNLIDIVLVKTSAPLTNPKRFFPVLPAPVAFFLLYYLFVGTIAITAFVG